MRKGDPLVIFADDYGRHPSSSQHLISRMLAERDVLWVNTIGTRRPRLCVDDLKRGIEKMKQWSKPCVKSVKQDTHRPIVINPPMLPGFSSPVSRAINARLLSWSVNRAISQHFDKKPVAITTLPVTCDLIGRLPVKKWIYYCVDDFAAWPGLDGSTLQAMDDRLLEKVDDVAAVSQVLADKAVEFGHTPTMITHGIDLDKWSDVRPEQSDDPVIMQIAQAPGPCAVFWGLIDPRLDMPMLQKLAKSFSGTLVFVGPTQGDISELAKIENVILPGPVDHSLLPQIGQAADVLIMPYRKCQVTKAMQPLKLMEYLATGKPVVCTDLPAVGDWADCCDVVSSDKFPQQVHKALQRGLTESQKDFRSRRLTTQSWEAKAALLDMLIDKPVGKRIKGKYWQAA